MAIEVNISPSKVDRPGIYAALGVAEVWRFRTMTVGPLRSSVRRWDLPDRRGEPLLAGASRGSRTLGARRRTTRRLAVGAAGGFVTGFGLSPSPTERTSRRSSAREAGVAVCAAHRWHLLHQPMVRHDRVDPQDDRPDRPRRRRGDYYGRSGQDTSGQAFRHGERVGEGERGVLEKPYGPGKYAFNTYAGNIVLVPTTNFVLHWVTGRTETHRYDESPRSTWSPRTLTSRRCRCRWSFTSITRRRRTSSSGSGT